VLHDVPAEIQGCRIDEQDFSLLGDALCNMPALSSVGLPADIRKEHSAGAAVASVLSKLAARLPRLSRVCAPCLQIPCLCNREIVQALTEMVSSCPHLYELHLGEGHLDEMGRRLHSKDALDGAATLSEALQLHGVGGCVQPPCPIAMHACCMLSAGIMSPIRVTHLFYSLVVLFMA
jgi:hypothetical protein